MLTPTLRANAVAAAIILTLSGLYLVGCGDDDPTPVPSPVVGSNNDDANNEPSGPEGHPRSCSEPGSAEPIAPPAIDFERNDYRFELGAATVSSYEGTIIRTATISDPPVIDRAMFLGTGGFLDDGCVTTQDGTSFRWEGVACEATPGTLFNVFVVEPDALRGVSALYTGSEAIRVTGYPIAKFLDFSPGGGFWQPGSVNETQGQVALWVTDMCALDGGE